jgi:hypothetical protein
MGWPDPATWTVSPEVFSARMTSLPEGLQIGLGQVSVTFPPGDPLLGVKNSMSLTEFDSKLAVLLLRHSSLPSCVIL